MPEWIVTPEESGHKLLSFLMSRLQGQYSARSLKRMIEHNGCQVNGRTERFASAALGKRDHVYLNLESLPSSLPFSIEARRILYEDDALFVYDKPAGISSDEKGILKLLRTHAPSLELVHRLDRDTTGVLLLAKNPSVLENLSEQFRKYEVKKRYEAIVDGILEQPKGIIENELGKKSFYEGQTIWGKVKKGKGLYAHTEWQRIKNGKKVSYVACFPKTGRTHQIRVHLAGLGHPILGDYQYGRQFQCSYHPFRPLLHAKTLWFCHPVTGEALELSAPFPDDFKDALQKLFR